MKRTLSWLAILALGLFLLISCAPASKPSPSPTGPAPTTPSPASTPPGSVPGGFEAAATQASQAGASAATAASAMAVTLDALMGTTPGLTPDGSEEQYITLLQDVQRDLSGY